MAAREEAVSCLCCHAFGSDASAVTRDCSGPARLRPRQQQQTLTWDDDDIQDTVHGLKSLVLQNFFAYAPNFTGGVRVDIVRDISGDGLADLILAAGPGGGPHIKLRSGLNDFILSSFYAYVPSFTGGLFVGGY